MTAGAELGHAHTAGRLGRAGAVHKVTVGGERYVLLMNAQGRYLSVAGTPDDDAHGRALTTTPHASDEACWLLRTKHSVGDVAPAAAKTPPKKKWMVKREAKASQGTTVPPRAKPQPQAPAWSPTIGEVTFHHQPTGTVLQSSPAQAPWPRVSSEGVVSAPGIGEAVTLSTSAGDLDPDGGRVGSGSVAATFQLLHGPDRLPSEYLVQMRETGYCAMPSLIVPSALAELRYAYGLDGTMPDQRQQGPASTVSAKVLAHPIVSWIAHQYMCTSELRVGAGPSLVTLQPGQNAEAVGGWHCDYPYAASHVFSDQYPYLPWGRYPDSDAEQPGSGVLGLLCNICIDEFTAQNGATMFALGSASEGTAPPSEWEGLSILNQVPAGGPSGSGVDRKAEQLVAPAGTIILYDCRTWHRQHANLSQQPRSCLLTIFTPRWVLPAHGDQTRMRNAMLSAPGVTARETERLIHLLGDSNAAVENWPVVRSTLPDEHEAVEGYGSTTPGHQELADTNAWRQASKL